MLVGYMRVSTDSDRQVLDLQRDALVAPGLVELAAAHAGLQDVQLGFTHGALEAKQQSIVESGRVIGSVMLMPLFVRSRVDNEMISGA
jgi:hypothetical protein